MYEPSRCTQDEPIGEGKLTSLVKGDELVVDTGHLGVANDGVDTLSTRQDHKIRHLAAMRHTPSTGMAASPRVRQLHRGDTSCGASRNPRHSPRPPLSRRGFRPRPLALISDILQRHAGSNFCQAPFPGNSRNIQTSSPLHPTRISADHSAWLPPNRTETPSGSYQTLQAQ